jgi:hypothetical protein
LRRSEQGERPAAEVAGPLDGSYPAAAFADWVGRRREQDLRNDDVTLVIIDL